MEPTTSRNLPLPSPLIDAVTRLVPEIEFKTSPEAGFHSGTLDPDILRAGRFQKHHQNHQPF